MWRIIIGSIMMLFVLLEAITNEQQPGDPRTYANMVGGILAIIVLPGIALFFVGSCSQNHKR